MSGMRKGVDMKALKEVSLSRTFQQTCSVE
jgi:hypothetical protein